MTSFYLIVCNNAVFPYIRQNSVDTLLYPELKIIIRLALRLFCSRIDCTNKQLFTTPGPLLIVANHPNSFLDAIVIASRFRHPVHFLARGDVFTRFWHNKLLDLLNIIPIYRLSEGKENLGLNAFAFERSKQILSQNGVLLIFIEGICVNKQELQPFKKGAARIALNCLENNIAISVMPLGIAYDSFHRFGKTIIIQPGEPIKATTLLPYDEPAKNMIYFNNILSAKLNPLIQLPGERVGKTHQQILLTLPAAIGYVLHAPLYQLLKQITRHKTAGTVFYDSVLFTALLLVYPFYLLLLLVILSLLHVPAWIVAAAILLHPFLAWCAGQWLSFIRNKP